MPENQLSSEAFLTTDCVGFNRKVWITKSYLGFEAVPVPLELSSLAMHLFLESTDLPGNPAFPGPEVDYIAGLNLRRRHVCHRVRPLALNDVHT